MAASDTSRLPPTRPPRAATTRALKALAPRERWTPAQWAENSRVLSEEESSEPGPYSFDRTPYWRDVLDAMADPAVEEVVCIKGAQIGWSEVCRNAFGYWVDLDPGPTMILMPDQKSAEDFKVERIDPLVKNTAAVARHLTARSWDDTKHRIRFDTMTAYFVWAGSKSGTKSRPIRRLICEEPDEYPPFSSTGGDPLSKAEKRLTTYRDKGRAKILIGGTPTTRRGNTSKRWEMCALRFHYWVPCPHCNGFQLLQWKQVKIPPIESGEDRAAHAERVKAVGLAYYECEHCKGRVDDHHKPRMLRRGKWASEDQAVTVDGRIVGPKRVAKRIGFKISGLYSPWVLFGQLASEWVEAQGDPNALADFINQRLAEVFEEQRQKTEPTLISDKANGGPKPGVIPSWAQLLIATADTQGNNDQDGYFWYVVRAWGYDYRSQLVDYGIARSREELRQRTVDKQFPFEDGRGSGSPLGLWVDSGGPRWNEVYQMAQADERIRPTKGSAHKRTWMVNERPQKKHNVVLWEIDTDRAKDELHRQMHDPDRSRWMPHNAVGEDYCKQLCSESKIFDPMEKCEKWVEVVKDNNHLWDCEATQCAVAWRVGAGQPEPPKEDPRSSEPEPSERPSSYATSYKGKW